MTDMTLKDMTPFLERHERWTRNVFVAMLCTSLVASAVIFTHGVRTRGSPAALAELWFAILGVPFVLIWLRVGPVLWARSRPAPPEGRFLMNADDARSVARVANAGFVFVTGLGAIMIAGQAALVPGFSGALESLHTVGDWTWRATTIATGVLMIHFGNAWPRMPTPREPAQKPATQTKYKRFYGWLIVVHGLLLALAALLPVSVVIPAIGFVSISLLIFTVASLVTYCIAMKSPRES